MLRFLKSSGLVVLCNFRIAFSCSLTGHCQVHANLGALALEVLTQTLEDLRINTFCYTDSVLVSPSNLSAYLLLKFGSRRFALWAEFRWSLSCINIATNFANPFFHDTFSSLHFIVSSGSPRWSPNGSSFNRNYTTLVYLLQGCFMKYLRKKLAVCVNLFHSLPRMNIFTRISHTMSAESF